MLYLLDVKMLLSFYNIITMIKLIIYFEFWNWRRYIFGIHHALSNPGDNEKKTINLYKILSSIKYLEIVFEECWELTTRTKLETYFCAIVFRNPMASRRIPITNRRWRRHVKQSTVDRTAIRCRSPVARMFSQVVH